MEDLKPIQHLFPATIEITQEVLDKGRENLMDCNHCIGVVALRTIITDERYISWAGYNGSIRQSVSLNIEYFNVQSFNEDGTELIYMESIREPQKIVIKPWKKY